MRKQKEKDLSAKVMKAIDKKEVKMRPKAYFVLGSLLLGIGMAGAIGLAMFFTHLAVFRLRVHAPFAFLRLGQPGLRPFLVNFPWLPLVLAVGGIVGGIVLLRRYEISYKKSFLALAIGLVALVLTFGFFLDQLGANRSFSRLKPMKPLYKERFEGQDWVWGEVVKLDDNQLTIETKEEKKVIIIWNEKTKMPMETDFQKGDQVKAVGEWQNGTLKAKGILRYKTEPYLKKKMGPGEVRGKFQLQK